MSFKNLGLADPLVRALEAKGYVTPTPIQRDAIPTVLTGRDLLGIAQTGTGKTAAFVLPSIQRLVEDAKRVLPTHCRMRGLDHPRWLYRLPNGDVLVAEANSPPREVGEDDRRLLTAVPIDRVDQVGDFLLGQVLFQQPVAHRRVVREQGGDLHPPWRGLDDLADQLAVSIHFRMPGADLGVQRNHAGIQSLLQFGHVGERLALAGLAVLDQRQVVETQHDI
eukprot:gene35600-47877_t